MIVLVKEASFKAAEEEYKICEQEDTLHYNYNQKMANISILREQVRGMITRNRQSQHYHTSREMAPRPLQVMWMHDRPSGANQASSRLSTKTKKENFKLEIMLQKAIIMVEAYARKFQGPVHRQIAMSEFASDTKHDITK